MSCRRLTDGDDVESLPWTPRFRGSSAFSAPPTRHIWGPCTARAPALTSAIIRLLCPCPRLWRRLLEPEVHMAEVLDRPATLRLNPSDPVVVAMRDIAAGESVTPKVKAAEPITRGHKVAIEPIAAGKPVRKFGQIIGNA